MDDLWHPEYKICINEYFSGVSTNINIVYMFLHIDVYR